MTRVAVFKNNSNNNTAETEWMKCVCFAFDLARVDFVILFNLSLTIAWEIYERIFVGGWPWNGALQQRINTHSQQHTHTYDRHKRSFHCSTSKFCMKNNNNNSNDNRARQTMHTTPLHFSLSHTQTHTNNTCTFVFTKTMDNSISALSLSLIWFYICLRNMLP